MPGDVIDGYRVTKLVAEGAMGEVYLAVDEQLGRRVALKFVKAAALDPKGLERFRDEARVTAQFNHPHIVTVYAAGAFEGRPFLALEYLDGQTLRERLEQGPLTVPEALRLGRAIAQALAEAHRRDVIHADLKPENVLLPRDGRVRVVDFGLARLVGAEGTAASGTPAYMAPERWSARPPHASMDVWALGVLLHEAIQGERPLSEQALAQLVYSPKPVTMGARVQSAPCSALISECLRLDPNERPTANDVLARIERLLAGRDVAEGRSPFRGLEAFCEVDAPDFHGRTQEIDAALEKLRTDALVPIVGPSGVGKSSFVFAGVVPRLREGGVWEIVSLRPGRRPWVSLAAALGCEVTSLETTPGGLVAALRSRTSMPSLKAETSSSLANALHRVKTRLLLLIDQFEELVTLSDEVERLSFLRALALAASPDEPWRVMVTVRSDFLGAFASAPELTSALKSVLVLRPLSKASLQEAIAAPLQRVGYELDDPRLPEEIASELIGKPAALPLLQFACQALWERRHAAFRLILRREYDAMGGAVGALATHAERLVSELLPQERRLTRALMLRLINPDGTRRPRSRAELLEGTAGRGEATQQSGSEAAAVLDRLVTNRLVVSRRQDAGLEPLFELAHESLVSTWPQLARWLAETQEARALTEEIEQAALIWDKRGRRDDETWVNEALVDATRRVQKWNVSLNSTPRDFIAAGQARQARLARRQRRGLVAAFSAISLLALTSGAAALEFREKERVAIEQQELIRLAAGDVGRFELVLEPFDWSSQKLERAPVSAAALPGLDWRLHEASRSHPPVRGKAIEGLRRSERRVDDQGALHEVVEVRSDSVFLEVFGRGDCHSSWLLLKTLPGFADRKTPPQQVRIPVPTCAATREGTVRLSAPDGGSFALDRTEMTSEQWSVYAELEPLTGDQRTQVPPNYVPAAARGLPLVGVDAAVAERLCQFFGRRLPTVAQWLRGAATHPQLTGKEVKGCVANLAGDADGSALMAPVGQCVGDVTEEGVADLLGNVSEWTADDDLRSEGLGLRHYLGSNWDFPADAPPGQLGYLNGAPPTTVNFGLGVRCASQ